MSRMVSTRMGGLYLCVCVCVFLCVSVHVSACMPVCISVHSCSAGSHLNVLIATGK